MFGFLKNLLRKPQEDPANVRLDIAEAPVSEPAYADPGAGTQQHAAAAPQNGRGVELPLQNIISSLPLELQPRVRVQRVGNMTITVPLEKVLAQLSRGAVRISFGELRQAVPEVFTAENDRDRVLVSLPLADILARVNPALIARRRVQRQVHVPAEISSPFDGDASGLMLSNTSARQEPAPEPAPLRQAPPPPVAPKAPSRAGFPSVPPPAAPGGIPTRPSLRKIPAPTPPSAAPGAFSQPSAPAAPATPAPAAPIAFRAPAAPRPPVAPSAPFAAPKPPAPSPIPMPGLRKEAPPAPTQPQPHTFGTKPPLPRLPQKPEVPAARMMPPAPKPAPAATPFTTPAAPPAQPSPTVFAAPPSAPIPTPAPVRAAVPPPTPAPAPVQTPAPIAFKPLAAPAKAEPAGEPIIVPLSALADAWPEPVRKEIVEMNLVDAKVALPLTAAEQGLKQGRIAFSWKTIRSWMKPAAPQSPSGQDGTVVEFPLKVIAPAFLTRQKSQAKPQQKVTIDEDIPNLFFGFPQAEAGVPVAQATARPTDTNYYVWDDASDMARVHEAETRRGATPGTKFVAKYATPNEVVSRAAGLDGVNGALIALPDGLMVANRLPPDVNADTLAAFLPQIFGKVSQCTKELRMGELNNLNFTVGNVPWKIFRVNSIFFAAFGRAGEPLPTAQLAALAAELDHNPR